MGSGAMELALTAVQKAQAGLEHARRLGQGSFWVDSCRVVLRASLSGCDPDLTSGSLVRPKTSIERDQPNRRNTANGGQAQVWRGAPVAPADGGLAGVR